MDFGDVEDLFAAECPRRQRAGPRGWAPGFREQVDQGVRHMDFGPITLELAYRDKGTASSVWDAGIALCKYLELHNEVAHRRVLDVGSGTGVCGLYAGALGAASVVLTDVELGLLRVNAKRFQACPVEVRRLQWGDDAVDADVVLCADCLLPYAPELVEPLCRTLRGCVDKGATVLLAYEERMDCSSVFEYFKGVVVEAIDRADMHPVYSAPDIHIFRITQLDNTRC